MSDGITDFDFLRCLDARDNITDIAGRQGVARRHVEFEHADFVGVIFFACGDKFDKIVFFYRAVLDLEVGDDASERVEDRVENQRLERSVRVALGRGDAFGDGP